jgi:hypothetical protein
MRDVSEHASRTARPRPRGATLRIVALAVAVAASVASPRAGDAQAARLTLEQVLGQSATSLTVPFGSVDASCTSVPAAGVTCAADPGGTFATWHGAIQFRARLTGAGGGRLTLRLAGARAAGGTMPAGRLVDGATGVPATPYPTAPATPLTLATAIPQGNTLVTRRIGVRVLTSDAGGTWNTSIVYSLIVE